MLKTTRETYAKYPSEYYQWPYMSSGSTLSTTPYITYTAGVDPVSTTGSYTLTTTNTGTIKSQQIRDAETQIEKARGLSKYTRGFLIEDKW